MVETLPCRVIQLPAISMDVHLGQVARASNKNTSSTQRKKVNAPVIKTTLVHGLEVVTIPQKMFHETPIPGTSWLQHG